MLMTTILSGVVEYISGVDDGTAYILIQDLMELFLFMFGVYSLLVRYKTALLFFSICTISFGLLIAFIEAVQEIRDFVNGQTVSEMKKLDEPVTKLAYELSGWAKYTRLLNGFTCLTAGVFFYLIRHSIVMLNVGNLSKEHLIMMVEKRIESVDLSDHSDSHSRIDEHDSKRSDRNSNKLRMSHFNAEKELLMHSSKE